MKKTKYLRSLFYIRLGHVKLFEFWTGQNWANVIQKNSGFIALPFAKAYTFQEAINLVNKRWPKGTKKSLDKNGNPIQRVVKIVPTTNPLKKIDNI